MTDNDIRKLIGPWLKGTLDEKQTLAVEQWVSSSTEHREEAKEVYRSIQMELGLEGMGTLDTERAALDTTRIIKKEKRSRTTGRAAKWTLAVLLPALCVLCFFLVRLFVSGAGINHFESLDGVNAVELADGTKVVLNGNTVLSYPERFVKKTRRVELSGTGWFEVAPQRSSDFMVQAGDVRVSASGTSFNVETSPSGDVKMSLAKGFTMLEYPDSLGDYHRIRLFPGDECIYEKVSGSVRVATCDADTVASWRKEYIDK